MPIFSYGTNAKVLFAQLFIFSHQYLKIADNVYDVRLDGNCAGTRPPVAIAKVHEQKVLGMIDFCIPVPHAPLLSVSALTLRDLET